MNSSIETIMAEIPSRPTNIHFLNGSFYIQHNRERILKVRGLLLRLGYQYCNNQVLLNAICSFTIPDSYIFSILDQHSKPLASAWFRLCCLDSQLREWSHPYIAKQHS